MQVFVAGSTNVDPANCVCFAASRMWIRDSGLRVTGAPYCATPARKLDDGAPATRRILASQW
jgi:hypothetical protein